MKSHSAAKKGKFAPFSPTQELADENLIAQAIWECLRDNEPEAVVEIIVEHLDAINKLRMCEDSDLPRSTLYSMFHSKNPTVKTLAKVISSNF